MNTIVREMISSIELSAPQSHGGVTVFPIRVYSEPMPEYLPLGEALQKELLKIMEVNESGSVPELRVENLANSPVLLLDGEELMGAKQNRVVNTTVLLRKRSNTIIPVSCTERGRWNYVSPVFEDSEIVMSRVARSRKSRSVSESLRSSRGHRSDQMGVWDEVDRLGERLGSRSRSSAMRDGYMRRAPELDEWLTRFPHQPEQTGFVVLVEGKAVGAELLPNPGAYRQAHAKLLKSYLIDLLGERLDQEAEAGEAVARAFLDGLPSLEESTFPSVGHGVDLRYEREEVCGSALVYEDALIHAAFFVEAPGAGRRGRHPVTSFTRA
ncbi:MAG: hypothetical protein KF886_05680 [Candidatus Hydrogenedentes bacterium]|nr:hypothetical protein [Candidatus Hydrogenedentota bacterium]